MVRIHVEGMTCTGCANAVSAAVAQATGGAPVRVSLATGTVEIDGEVDSGRVTSAIEDAGFLVVSAPAQG